MIINKPPGIKPPTALALHEIMVRSGKQLDLAVSGLSSVIIRRNTYSADIFGITKVMDIMSDLVSTNVTNASIIFTFNVKSADTDCKIIPFSSTKNSLLITERTGRALPLERVDAISCFHGTFENATHNDISKLVSENNDVEGTFRKLEEICTESNKGNRSCRIITASRGTISMFGKWIEDGGLYHTSLWTTKRLLGDK